MYSSFLILNTFLVTMDPRQQTDAEGEQFLLNIIAECGGAQGDVPE